MAEKRTSKATEAATEARRRKTAEIRAAGRAALPVPRSSHNEPYVANYADAEKVLKGAGAGMSIKQICALVGCGEHVLRRDYAEELEKGHAIAIAAVTDVAYKIATDIHHPKVAQMNQFWLRARANWKVNDTLTVVGPDGRPVMDAGGKEDVIDVSALSPDERAKLRAALEQVAVMRAEAKERELLGYEDDDGD